MVLGHAETKAFLDSTVDQSEITVHGGHQHRSNVRKREGSEVCCQAVNIEVGGFWINFPSFEFCSVCDASVAFELGEFFKHIAVSNQEGVEVL